MGLRLTWRGLSMEIMAATSLEQFSENYRDTIDRLYSISNAAAWRVSSTSFAGALFRSFERRFGAQADAVNRKDAVSFLDSIHAADLALAIGCRDGDAAAWRHLVATYRAPIDNNGTLSAVDVQQEEHERYERALWIRVHRQEPTSQEIGPLPQFAKEAQAANKVLAAAGGGSIRSLSHDTDVNHQAMILVFGDKWQAEVSRFASR
jgi:hypothetical protein